MYPHALPPAADVLKAILKDRCNARKHHLHGKDKVTMSMFRNILDDFQQLSDCDDLKEWGPQQTNLFVNDQGFPFTLERLEPLVESSIVARILYACRLLFERAFALLESGDKEAFVQHIAAAYRLDSRPITTTFDTSEICIEVAESDTSPGIKADAFYALSNLAFGVNEAGLALHGINEALQLEPEDPTFYYMQGIVLNSIAKFEEADLALQHATALDDNPEYLWLRGCILENLGGNGPTSLGPAEQATMRQEACALLKEFVRQSPPESDKVCQAWYHMAEMEIINGNLGAAKRLLDNGLAAELAQLSCFDGPPSNFRRRAELRLRDINACASEVCPNIGIEVCSGCLKVRYCSRDCQKSHWKEHKPLCHKVDPKVHAKANKSKNKSDKR